MESATGPVITGLDIGASKVATVIARKTPEGGEILGMGVCPTEGVREGGGGDAGGDGGTADLPSTRNLVRCVEKAEINIVDIVLSPLASAEAVLTPEEREVGVALLDFGGGTVDMAIFYDGALRHTFVLPLGGGNITADVAVGLRIPAADAESLKIASGCAARQKVRRHELVEWPGVGGRQPRPIRRQYLSEIIEPRAEEIFTLLRKGILRSGFEEMLGAGIVLKV